MTDSVPTPLPSQQVSPEELPESLRRAGLTNWSGNLSPTPSTGGGVS